MRRSKNNIYYHLISVNLAMLQVLQNPSSTHTRLFQNFLRFPKSKIQHSSQFQFPNRSATTVSMANLSTDATSRGSITHIIFDMDGLLLGKFLDYLLLSFFIPLFLCFHLLPDHFYLSDLLIIFSYPSLLFVSDLFVF